VRSARAMKGPSLYLSGTATNRPGKTQVEDATRDTRERGSICRSCFQEVVETTGCACLVLGDHIHHASKPGRGMLRGFGVSVGGWTSIPDGWISQYPLTVTLGAG
jgi:hypothetical protein